MRYEIFWANIAGISSTIVGLVILAYSFVLGEVNRCEIGDRGWNVISTCRVKKYSSNLIFVFALSNLGLILFPLLVGLGKLGGIPISWPLFLQCAISTSIVVVLLGSEKKLLNKPAGRNRWSWRFWENVGENWSFFFIAIFIVQGFGRFVVARVLGIPLFALLFLSVFLTGTFHLPEILLAGLSVTSVFFGVAFVVVDFATFRSENILYEVPREVKAAISDEGNLIREILRSQERQIQNLISGLASCLAGSPRKSYISEQLQRSKEAANRLKKDLDDKLKQDGEKSWSGRLQKRLTKYSDISYINQEVTYFRESVNALSRAIGEIQKLM